MKCRRQRPCSLLLLVWFVQLVSSSFLYSETTAFVHKREACTRIHNRVDDTFRFARGGSYSTSKLFGNGNAEERQDAFGRSIPPNDGNCDDQVGPPDPLLELATASTEGTNPNNNNNNNNPIVNLDPLVVCGPSGVGKGTVIESLRKRFPPNAFGFSVSHTTRQPRPGELNGKHYYFTTKEEIQKDIDNGLFVEHALVHGNYYGTSKNAIEILQAEGAITILDIDMQGVISVKESGIPARYVFLAPPSTEELESRLRGRGTETEEAIAKRLGNAAQEIEYGMKEGNFDRVFVNHDVEQTVDEMVMFLSDWFPQLKTMRNDNSSPPEPTTPNDQAAIRQRHFRTKQVPPQKFDFLEESDKMTRFKGVRKGHGKFVGAADGIPDRGYEFRARHHGAYTVDLEEPDGPRGYPKLGRTNPNIPIDSDLAFEDTPDARMEHRPMFNAWVTEYKRFQTESEHQPMFNAQRTESADDEYLQLYSSSFIDLEEPDGNRGHLKFSKSDHPVRLGSDAAYHDAPESISKKNALGAMFRAARSSLSRPLPNVSTRSGKLYSSSYTNPEDRAQKVFRPWERSYLSFGKTNHPVRLDSNEDFDGKDTEIAF